MLKKMKKTRLLCLLVGLIFPLMSLAQTVTPIAEINAVDDTGTATFPGLQTMDKVTAEGIVLNDPVDFSGGGDAPDYIVFIQDETGGIELYSGGWYGGGLKNYPSFKPGDRIRATGLTTTYGGQTNISERHNPDQKFTVEKLSSGSEPAPLVIEDLAQATQFDKTRKTGGEYYQGRLVILKKVKIVEGEWKVGEDFIVADSKGGKLTVGLRGSFQIGNQTTAPTGEFDVVGVFNQEDGEAPYTAGYQLWPRTLQDFKLATSHVSNWDVLQ